MSKQTLGDIKMAKKMNPGPKYEKPGGKEESKKHEKAETKKFEKGEHKGKNK